MLARWPLHTPESHHNDAGKQTSLLRRDGLASTLPDEKQQTWQSIHSSVSRAFGSQYSEAGVVAQDNLLRRRILVFAIFMKL